MAGFEGVHWAPHQMLYFLDNKEFSLLDRGGKVFAVSKSIHYGLFLAFEGIRFFCKHGDKSGTLEVFFFNWDLNLERFRKGIAFNLSQAQQPLVPEREELRDIFIGRYFQDPDMRPFPDLPQCIFRRCTRSSFYRALNKGIIHVFPLLLIFFLSSCASVNRATYESQRRGLLMLEGEHIYKNKGFYKTKKSNKRRKKTMRAHKKSLRR